MTEEDVTRTPASMERKQEDEAILQGVADLRALLDAQHDRLHGSGLGGAPPQARNTSDTRRAAKVSAAKALVVVRNRTGRPIPDDVLALAREAG